MRLSWHERLRPGREDEALAVSERSLARSLLDGLAASGTDFGHGTAAPELHARERKLEEEMCISINRSIRKRKV
ncbi:MAG: hypothetical protein WAM82_02385 [Thermoanaerobaculia bacterium]